MGTAKKGVNIFSAEAYNIHLNTPYHLYYNALYQLKLKHLEEFKKIILSHPNKLDEFNINFLTELNNTLSKELFGQMSAEDKSAIQDAATQYWEELKQKLILGQSPPIQAQNQTPASYWASIITGYCFNFVHFICYFGFFPRGNRQSYWCAGRN